MPSSIGAQNPLGSGESDDLLSGDTVKQVASLTIGAVLFLGIPLVIAANVLRSATSSVEGIDYPTGGGGL